jgi:hypothetical protein
MAAFDILYSINAALLVIPRSTEDGFYALSSEAVVLTKNAATATGSSSERARRNAKDKNKLLNEVFYRSVLYLSALWMRLGSIPCKTAMLVVVQVT